MEIKTRKQAMLDGENTYFTGTPCKNGHITYRYSQSGSCHDCINGHKISAESHAARARELRLSETAATLRTKLDAKAALVLVRVRIIPKIREQVSLAAFALASMRYPCLTTLDVDPELVPTDRHAGSGQALYAFYCHDEDIDALRTIAASMLRDALPKVQFDMNEQIAKNRAAAKDDPFVDTTPPMSFK